MGIASELIEKFDLCEMAWHRDDFVDRIRDKHLGGALAEYTKLKISLKLGLGDYWSNEVKSLLEPINKLMSDRTKTKKGFNQKAKQGALIEAIREASIFSDKIVQAKNELISLNKYEQYHKHWKEIKKMKLDSQILMKEMIVSYLPEYKNIIGNLTEYYS